MQLENLNNTSFKDILLTPDDFSLIAYITEVLEKSARR